MLWKTSKQEAQKAAADQSRTEQSELQHQLGATTKGLEEKAAEYEQIISDLEGTLVAATDKQASTFCSGSLSMLASYHSNTLDAWGS